MYLGPSYLAKYHHVLAPELTTHTSLTPPSIDSETQSILVGESIIEDDLADGGNGLLVTLASSGYGTIPHIILFIDCTSTPTSIGHPSHITVSITPFQ